MPMKQITPMSAVQDYLNEQIEEKQKILLEIVFYVGEAGLFVARVNGSYIDRSGNLRSSVGYVVVKNGQIVYISSFEQVPARDASNPTMRKGSDEGRDFAKKVIRDFPEGVALVEVAGMNYAGYVSAKGYDVLDSAEDEVKRLFLSLLKKYGFIVK